MDNRLGRLFHASKLKNVVSVGGCFIDAAEVKGRAQALLSIVQLVNETLATVKIMRKEYGAQINDVDRHWIDVTVIPNAKMALERVAKIVESARVDMSCHHGQMSWKAKTMFVLKDGPRIVESMTLLNTASSGLMTAITLLRTNQGQRDSMEQRPPQQKSSLSLNSPSSDRIGSNHSPNSGRYGETQFPNGRRQSSTSTWPAQHNTSSITYGTSGVGSSPNFEPIPELAAFDVFLNDTGPVYTGNDSFILLGEPKKSNARGPPDITLTSPTTVGENHSVLDYSNRQSPKHVSYERSEGSPSVVVTSWENTAPKLGRDSSYRLIGNRLEQSSHLADTSITSGSAVSLPENSGESRGRQSLKRQAGIP